ncbi:HlyD family efflux transporter periplasmic adaptor subunit [Geminocystis sp. CENA526]|uniref:efflux RND transporter periplasmic adaptor subunit n=1 Tax=Geminocystis sp. CENA526 TaxID=1355871 RepID=UPI003D6F7744
MNISKLRLTQGLGLKWLFISSATLTIITLGGLLFYGLSVKNNTKPVTVRTTTVIEGNVENKITGESGVLKLDNQRVIRGATNGMVEEILVNIGDVVKKGKILVRLRDNESQIKLQEFQLDLKTKTIEIEQKELALQRTRKKVLQDQQEYEKLRNNYQNILDNTKQEKTWEIEKSKLEVIQKEQIITQAEIDLNESKIKLKEDQQLFNRGFISENELKEQQKKVSLAETALTNAKNQLLVSQINLDKQKLDLDNFLKNIQENNSEPQQKLKEAQSKLEESQLAIKEAELALNQAMREVDKLKIQQKTLIETLNKTVITSPINGVILNLNVKVGDVIDSKQNLLFMGDDSKQIVEFNLSPLDATKVKLGQPAEITVIGLDSEKLTGKVEEIALLAKQDDSSQSSNNAKVVAVIGLDKVNKNIVPSTPVAVTIIIAQRNNVLILPNEAIQQTDSDAFVWMRDSQGKAIKKSVKIGLQAIENTEIISGLKLGDEVLIPIGEIPLNEGNYVEIQ